MNQNKLIRLSAAVVVLSIAAAVLLPSDSKISSTHDYLAKRSLSQDVENALLHMSDNIYAEVFSLPKVYTLPWTLAPFLMFTSVHTVFEKVSPNSGLPRLAP